MRSQDATVGEYSLVRRGALVASSVLVVLVAAGFDTLAEEPPTHTLTVALVAVVVGLARWWWHGRLDGLFAAVNLAVVGQPAVHALTKLTYAGADALPHSHGWPETVSSVSMHLAVALLVVAVLASEPVCSYVLGAVVRALVRLTQAAPTPASGPSASTRHRDEPRARPHQLLGARHAPRRGPPLQPVLCI